MPRLTQWGALAVSLLVSAAFTFALWNKANTLLVGDLAWWLQCADRMANGELPYRDFFWHYPPLTLYVFGGATRLFGHFLWVPQFLIVGLSTMIVLMLWELLRPLLRPPVLAAVLSATVATAATSQTFFSMFSLMGYCPSLHLVALGLLFVLWGVIHLPERPAWGTVALIVGSWISLLAKQEAWLATPALFAFLLLRDHVTKGAQRRRILFAGAIGAALPALDLFRLEQAAGWDAFQDALTGHGLATIPCPWWPTGIGLWGMLAALGLGSFVVFAGTWLGSAQAATALGAKNYRRMAWGALIGLAVHSAYILRQVPDLLRNPIAKLWSSSPVIFSVTSVWRSAIWGAVVVVLWFGVKLWRGTKLDREQWSLAAWFTLVAGVAVRGLFGSIMTELPEVPAIAYSLVIPAGALLLSRALRGLLPENTITVFLVAILAGYGVLRTVGAWPGQLSNQQFGRVETPAGTLWVKDAVAHQAIVDFVLQRTEPQDTVLEFPLGGGVGFLTNRRTVGYSTMYSAMPSTPRAEQMDLERARANRPTVVIGKTLPHFGTFWGLVEARMCPFPNLVWTSVVDTWQPDYLFPVVDFVEKNYRVAATSGEWQMLMQKPNQAVQ